MITDKNGNKYFKVTLHTHSSASDGLLSPQDVVRFYKGEGFDCMALTDHWVYNDTPVIEGLPIISGIEYNMGGNHTETDVMHILALGMKYNPGLNNTMSRQEIIDNINKAGGIAVLAHPAWSLNTVEEAISLKGFAATEIYNAVSGVHESFRAYSDYYVDVLANKGSFMPLLAVDDSHYYDGTDNAKGYVMVKAENAEPDTILASIKNGDFYATQGPELYTEVVGDTVNVECSPASRICFVTNLSWTDESVTNGDGLTSATYKITEGVRWLRVDVIDSYGKHAWSNFIYTKSEVK